VLLISLFSKFCVLIKFCFAYSLTYHKRTNSCQVLFKLIVCVILDELILLYSICMIFQNCRAYPRAILKSYHNNVLQNYNRLGKPLSEIHSITYFIELGTVYCLYCGKTSWSVKAKDAAEQFIYILVLYSCNSFPRGYSSNIVKLVLVMI
jgi:hypothetical protein